MLNGYAKGFNKIRAKKLKLNNLYDYVSTEVVVLNLDNIRNDFSRKQIFETVEKRKIQNIASDGFNILFEGHIKFLSQKWNKIDCFGPEYFSLLEYFPADDFIQMNEAPNFINLRGISGQWLPQQSSGMHLFWYYARQTPFYEQILLTSVPNWAWPIFDLQCRVGVFDNRTGIRKFVDRIAPCGTKRRKLIHFLVPRDSLRWKFCKQILYIFVPKYRPVKPVVVEEAEDDE